MSVALEICIDSAESARAAAEGGADRLEVCGALASGGTTPSFGLVEYCVAELRVPVMMMIRPHDGGFIYTDVDIDVMLRDVEVAKSIGAQGVVFGTLTKDGSVNLEHAQRLLEAAESMDTTFHRAFDLAARPIDAFEQLQRLGMTRVLTSGQARSALEGCELIRRLVELAESTKVLAGAGIDASNVRQLVRETGVTEVHASASTIAAPSGSRTTVSFGAGRRVADRSEVAALVAALAE